MFVDLPGDSVPLSGLSQSTINASLLESSFRTNVIAPGTRVEVVGGSGLLLCDRHLSLADVGLAVSPISIAVVESSSMKSNFWRFSVNIVKPLDGVVRPPGTEVDDEPDDNETAGIPIA